MIRLVLTVVSQSPRDARHTRIRAMLELATQDQHRSEQLIGLQWIVVRQEPLDFDRDRELIEIELGDTMIDETKLCTTLFRDECGDSSLPAPRPPLPLRRHLAPWPPHAAAHTPHPAGRAARPARSGRAARDGSAAGASHVVCCDLPSV